MLTLHNHKGRLSFAFIFAGALSLTAPAAAAGPAVRITKVEATGSFESAKTAEPRLEIVRLTVENPGAALEASARVRLWGAADHEEPIGRLPAGRSTVTIHVPELPLPSPVGGRGAGVEGASPDRSELTIVLYQNGESKPIAIEELPWPPQPPPKSNLSCATYARRAWGRRPHRLWARLRNSYP
jgi:hypothetical protein